MSQNSKGGDKSQSEKADGREECNTTIGGDKEDVHTRIAVCTCLLLVPVRFPISANADRRRP